MNSIAFIINGKYQIKRWVQKTIAEQFDSFHRFKLFYSKEAKASVRLTEEAINQGFQYIIAVGGDGTLNEVANGIMNSRNSISSTLWNTLRMGVIPMGTGNDFIRTIGAPKEVRALKKLIEQEKFRSLDLGLIRFINPDGEAEERYFINTADVGMGGVAVKKINGYSKWIGSNLTYQRGIISTFFSYRKKKVSVKGSDFQYQGNIMDVVFANGKYFGSGLGIAPDANPSDGKLEVVILGEVSILDYLKKLPLLKKCFKIDHPQVFYYSDDNIKLEGIGEQLPLGMDGEFVGYTPFEVTIIRNAIRFLC